MRGGKHYVADLGSANGTLLNGKHLAREFELRGGDRLTIGSVEFIFTPLTPPPEDETTQLGPPRGMRPRTNTRITRAHTEQEMQAIEAEDTGRHRTVTDPEVAIPADSSGPATLAEMAAVTTDPVIGPATLAEMPAAKVDTSGPATLAETPAVALAPSGPSTVTEVPTIPVLAKPSPRSPARVPGGKEKEEGVELSAAERARLRRQAKETLGGQLMLWWKELSPKGKSVAGVMTGLVVVGLLAVLINVFRPAKSARPKGPEPTEISLAPLPDSFGLGEGVTWRRPDEKALDFQFISPTRAVVVLHYQATNVSPQEVTISLNGVEQGWVPADTATSAEREIELILALPLLKRSERNRIVFDNVRNPPGQESWRVWNVYVEVIPVPELPEAELLFLARKQATTGQRFYEQKDVGSENLFNAWKNYRSAWITLEALENKPDLYNDVRFQMQQTGAELDQQCRKLMLDFQRNLQFRDGDKAVATVQEVIRRFPTTEHRCHNLAIEKATQYELPI
jgi:hypothetical protein